MRKVKNAVLAVVFLALVMLFGSAVMASSDTYACSGVDVYLALRSAKAFDYNNEIGKIYPGETVEVQSYDSGTYWYVYCPKLNKYGYVNKDYLVYKGSGSSSSDYIVRLDSGYLALRNAKAFDYSNEIGELYSGDPLDVLDTSDPQYWYVYSPTLNKYGYVNKDYVFYNGSKPSGKTTYKVKVNDGYLALRNAKAFDYNNEIGKLYTGDTVEVQDKSDSQYWYVYSPKHDKYGYVNKDFLKSSSSGSKKSYSKSDKRTVKVSESYLALRSAMAFDASNEIGELYTGDTVYVQEKTSDQYWYVYSPKHKKFGYVNKDFLRK